MIPHLFVQVLVGLIVLGLLGWLVEAVIPMDPRVKQLARAVVIVLAVALLIWALLTLL